MNHFEFGRAVEICGKTYYISSDMKTVSAVLSMTSEKLTELGKSNLSNDEKGKLMTSYFQEALDITLGKGSFDEIFTGRPLNYMDYFYLFQFITEEIREWQKEQNALLQKNPKQLRYRRSIRKSQKKG